MNIKELLEDRDPTNNYLYIEAKSHRLCRYSTAGAIHTYIFMMRKTGGSLKIRRAATALSSFRLPGEKRGQVRRVFGSRRVLFLLFSFCWIWDWTGRGS